MRLVRRRIGSGLAQTLLRIYTICKCLAINEALRGGRRMVKQWQAHGEAVAGSG